MDPHDQQFKLELIACLDEALAAARLHRCRCGWQLMACAMHGQGDMFALAAELVDAERQERYQAVLVDLVNATALEHDAGECIRRMPSLVSAAYRAAP